MNRGAPTGTKASADDAIVLAKLAEIERLRKSAPIKMPSAGSGDALVIKGISKTAHGFVVGDLLTFVGGTWIKAKANAVATSGYSGMVSAKSTDAFDLTIMGKVTGLSGLTAGTVYYLSDATSGAAIAKASLGATALTVPVYLALSTTSAYVFATSMIAEDLQSLVLGDASNKGSMRINFDANRYVEASFNGVNAVLKLVDASVTPNTIVTLDGASGSISISATASSVSGGISVSLPNSNVVSINKADFVGTGKTVKLREVDVCESGVAKKMLMLASQTY